MGCKGGDGQNRFPKDLVFPLQRVLLSSTLEFFRFRHSHLIAAVVIGVGAVPFDPVIVDLVGLQQG